MFDVLRKQQPDFKNKVIPIIGELTEERLGISDEDYQTLADKCVACPATRTRLMQPHCD